MSFKYRHVAYLIAALGVAAVTAAQTRQPTEVIGGPVAGQRVPSESSPNAAPKVQTPPKADSPPLTIMTFNVRHHDEEDRRAGRGWSERKNALIKVIEAEHPHVLGVQEIAIKRKRTLAEPPFQFIERELRQRGYVRSPGLGKSPKDIYFRSDRLRLAPGSSSRGGFALPPDPNSPCRFDPSMAMQGHRTATWAILQERSSGREFIVVNTHFSHRPENGALRRAQAACIQSQISALAKGRPILVMGDLNTKKGTAAYCTLVGSLRSQTELYDTHLGAKGGTFNGFCKDCVPKRKIDFILARGFAVARPSRVVMARWTSTKGEPSWPSDHCPVVVDVRFTEERSFVRPEATCLPR